MDLGKLPVFLENQQKGNYKVHLDPARNGARLRASSSTRATRPIPRSRKWLTNADFRRALSLGIDRDQLNETFWLGIGTPGSVGAGRDATSTTPAPSGARSGPRSTSSRPTSCWTRSG